MCDGGDPTIYGGFVQGVGVDLVIIIRHKHSSVRVPVVPQHSSDGGREVWELEAGVCGLDWTHTKTWNIIHIVLP